MENFKMKQILLIGPRYLQPLLGTKLVLQGESKDLRYMKHR